MQALQSGKAAAEEAEEAKQAEKAKLDAAAPSGPGKLYKAVVNIRGQWGGSR